MSFLHTSLVSLCLALTCHAQMSGVYTIDPAGSGPRNFATFSAATTALGTSGINGPVEFAVAIGTHTESWSIPPYAGASATNTVTIKSATPGFLKLTKLRGAGGDLLTIQGGVSNLLIEGLVFEGVSGAVAINALRDSNTRRAVDDVEIRDCFFDNTIVSHSSYGAIRTQSTNRWNIHHCEFDVSGTALYTQGALEMVVAHNKFNNNGYPYCLSLWNSNRSRCRIFNNLFTGKVTSEGIRAWPSHYQIDFWHNTFVLETAGWVVRNRQCCTVAWNTFYNNIFVVTGTGGAIYNQQGGQLESDHNIFHVASGKIGRNDTTDYTSLASWSLAIQGIAQKGAFDSNSIEGDPKLVSATDLHLTPSSPGVGMAKPTPVSFYSGHEVTMDFEGLMRGTKKDIGAYELTGWTYYGAGCTGTGGKEPSFSIGGNIAPGETASLDLANALANASVALALGAQKANIPFGGSCVLLNIPLELHFLQADASGQLSIPGTVPASLPITGTFAHVQFGVLDPGAAGGVAMTRGASVRL